jgi:NADH dehydrogenase
MWRTTARLVLGRREDTVKIRDAAVMVTGSLATGIAGWLIGRRGSAAKTPILGGWPRVVIVGGGFGGLRVARGLAGAAADVLLVDRHNYHCFQPLLYQVATAGLEPGEIAHPIREVLQGIPNLRFRLAEVKQVDLAGQQLVTDDGPIPYDYLVLAPGSQTNFFGIAGLAERALGLKDLNEAVELRNHLLGCFERAIGEADPDRRAALMTFVVAGGGPTGVEFAGALAELIRLVLVHDYPGLDVKDSRVILLEATPKLLPPFAPSLQDAARQALVRKGVDVRLSAPVKSYDGETVRLADDTTIASASLVWAAGVRGGDLGTALGVSLARGGRVAVEPTLQLPGHPEVYVVGDLASVTVDRTPLPMVAPVAIQEGERAAANLRRQLAGQPPLPFVYHDKGSMATIGRNAAVAQIGRFRFTGFLAWVVWLVVHLLQIVSFRNRLLVLVNWIWDYVFYDRAARLITED